MMSLYNNAVTSHRERSPAYTRLPVRLLTLIDDYMTKERRVKDIRAKRASLRGRGRTNVTPKVVGAVAAKMLSDRRAQRSRGVRSSRGRRNSNASKHALRLSACAVLAAGVAAPLLRRRLQLPRPAVIASSAAAPFALCVVAPRSRARDLATGALQMWAYLATYEMPNDDPAALERRVKIDYPVIIDRWLGMGKTPTIRLQRAFGQPGRIKRWEKVLVWTHWIWFSVPHGAVIYLRLRHPERFTRGACLVYATFDLGVLVYWLLPTAPPWYAAKKGRLHDGRLPELRRMMVEYGEDFWKHRWSPLYGLLGGNPLAAMPSLHFATSLMAAHVLGEAGFIPGVLGWSYAMTLAVALVYLGEHYVVDLLAGAALTEGIRRLAPAFVPAIRGIGGTVRALEARAHS